MRGLGVGQVSKQALGKTDNCTGLKQAPRYERHGNAGGAPRDLPEAAAQFC